MSSLDIRVIRSSRELAPPLTTQGARAALSTTAGDPGDARLEAVSTARIRAAASDVPHLLTGSKTNTGQFRALQEWEGTVVDRREDAIRVRLVDKTVPGPEEEAEILLEDISPADLPLVKAGAVFYWSVGYRDSPSGQRTRQSAIVFRRLPRWTEGELDALKEQARNRAAQFGWA